MAAIGCLLPFLLLVAGAAIGGVSGGTTTGGILGAVAGLVVGLIGMFVALRLFEHARDKWPG